MGHETAVKRRVDRHVVLTTGLALGPIFSGIALQTGFHPTTLPFVFIMVIAAVAALGVMFSWPRGVVTAPPMLRRLRQKSSLLDGLRITGGKFYVCAGALFIC